MLSNVKSLAAAALVAAGVAHAATVTVQVGADSKNLFSPETVQAAVGDTVEFVFAVGNRHNVERSASFTSDGACKGATGADALGVEDLQPAGAKYDVKINSTDPIPIFCDPHCALGMVMIINPGTGAQSLESFKAAARGESVTSSAGGAAGTATSAVGGAASTAISGASSVASAAASGVTSVASAVASAVGANGASSLAAPNLGYIAAGAASLLFGAIVVLA